MVLAIILVILSLLMPQLRRARLVARMTTCGNNLRQIMLAALSYETDYGRLPSPNWETNKDRGWLYADGKMDQLEHLRAGLLWPYLQSHHVYRCPSDRVDPATVPNRPNNARMITSYVANGSICAYGKRPYDATQKAYYTYRSADFRADDVLFWEPDETQAGGWWWDGSNYPNEGISARHFDRATAACADAHVEWITVRDWYALAQSAARPNRLWNVPWSTDGRTPR